VGFFNEIFMLRLASELLSFKSSFLNAFSDEILLLDKSLFLFMVPVINNYPLIPGFV